MVEKFLKEGTIDELANDEEARRLYLGSTFSMKDNNV